MSECQGFKPNSLLFNLLITRSDDIITGIDALTTLTGDWAINATGTLNLASKEDSTTIPKDQRDTRETIQAARTSKRRNLGRQA
ncbi:hypothetical protein QBC33DRAFT_561174 [Phialemonium atrogriseum]|uniref:Uncharacterized protein n=1 Tax=Phialemonium atrogriseum TaxID=1093897 RepID=A0AAJ0FE95_9PEZI|nr:uncharacterized protein QBC33DRAFT_561174 [Phialemonium atrogriseum]KAK1765356.1 hypothetical protein QBC33DRAFT_561174 [Phialemonium atrogriseum]